jgi:hypothetical protein
MAKPPCLPNVPYALAELPVPNFCALHWRSTINRSSDLAREPNYHSACSEMVPSYCIVLHILPLGLATVTHILPWCRLPYPYSAMVPSYCASYLTTGASHRDPSCRGDVYHTRALPRCANYCTVLHALPWLVLNYRSPYTAMVKKMPNYTMPISCRGA